TAGPRHGLVDPYQPREGQNDQADTDDQREDAEPPQNPGNAWNVGPIRIDLEHHGASLRGIRIASGPGRRTIVPTPLLYQIMGPLAVETSESADNYMKNMGNSARRRPSKGPAGGRAPPARRAAGGCPDRGL